MSVRWWWLSFADADLPEGSQFLGVAIVPGDNVVLAAMNAHMLGVNPGGEVEGVPIPSDRLPDESLRRRLLSRSELEAADLI